MSWLVVAFWLLLLVPGHRIAIRIDRSGVESGLPAAIALSFICAAGAATLLLIPLALMGAPALVLTVAIALLLLWGFVDMFVRRDAAPLARLAIGAVGLELVVLILDVWLGSRTGSLLGADAVVHVAHVRALLEGGLANVDPFIGSHFYPTYHTNVLHALLACASQATGEDPLVTWFSSLAFAKVLIACGGWYAGWALFGSAPAGWATALFLIGARGPVTFMIYPNQLAPWFLTPVLLATVVRALVAGADGRRVVMLSAASLVLGSIHGMYAIFIAMSVGPVLCVWVLTRLWRRAPDRGALIGCALAIGVGLPFPAVTHFTRAAPPPPLSGATSAPEVEGARDRLDVSSRLRQLDGGMVMHRFGRGFTGNRGVRVLLLLTAFSLMVTCGRMTEAGVSGAVFLAVAAWLHVPPLCTTLLHAGGAEWLLHRFATMQDVILSLVVPGSFVAVVEVAHASRSAPRYAASVFRCAFGLICIFAGAVLASQSTPYDWRTYLRRAQADEASRESGLRPLLRFADDLDRHVPSDAVVLAEPDPGMRVVMAHHCLVVSSTSSSLGVPDLGTRARDVRRMLRQLTDETMRSELLRKRGVTHMVVERPAPAWAYDRMRAFHVTEFNWCIIELGEPGSSARGVAGDWDRALLDAGRLDEAIDLMESMLVERPSRFGLRFRLGNACADVGRLDDALLHLRTASELRPDDPRPAIEIGNVLTAMEKYDEAIDAFERTAAIANAGGERDAESSALFNLGNTLYRLGRWDDAIEAYRSALRARPDHGGARHWLNMARDAAARNAPPPILSRPRGDDLDVQSRGDGDDE